MYWSSSRLVEAQKPATSIIRVVLLILIWAALAPATMAQTPSTRPGWGATPYHDASGTGVTFRVWAPHATGVWVPGTFNNWSTSATPLAKELTNGVWNGVWSANVASAAPGDQYKYYIVYDGTGIWKHDPRARMVTAPGTASGANDIIYDPTAFNWGGDAFTNPPLQDMVIYELHMGTFPPSSTPSRFISATNKLNYLESLGINMVEVMPIAEFPGGNSWGYNPAQPFAVENSAYGGPDGFKTFVKACHAHGIGVLLDVVHNHYGPTDLDMWNFDGWAGNNSLGGGGVYFYESNTNLQITPWGYTRPNFSSRQVDSFIRDNFIMWLNEYHVDGFRWDTPHTMLYANDGSYIPAAGSLISSINAMIHTNYPGKVSIAEDVYNSFGFDSAWDTSFPGAVTPVLTNTVDADRDMNVIANAVMYNVRYGGVAGMGRVIFLESHDVVGDLNGGERLVTAIDTNSPASYRARKLSTLGAVITFTAPGVPMIFQGQAMLENQAFDSSLPVSWVKTVTYPDIVQFYHDLISVRRDLDGSTPGLEGSHCSMLAVDNANKVVAYNRWGSSAANGDVVVIAHFANSTLNNYTLNFPAAGPWYVHLNSDSTNYGSDYGNIGSSVVTASGNPAMANVTIGPYSALILSQIPPIPPLSITRTNNGLTVSWPTAPSGWLLESSSTLTGSPSDWNQVPTAQYQTNEDTIFSNVNSTTSNRFYRLQKQP